MVRGMTMSVALGALAMFVWCPQAAAEPAADGTIFMIGKCFDPSQPVEQRPDTVVYNCEDTGIMRDMTWTSWGADGATGTGTDYSVECQPNCAEGALLVNPIVVHAWNPLPPEATGCPAGVEFYSDITIAYPQGVPPWIQPGTTWSPGTDFVTVDDMPAVHFSNEKPWSCAPLAAL